MLIIAVSQAVKAASPARYLALLASSAEDSGQTIAMVTHDPVAASFASQVVFLSDGRIVSESGRLSSEEISRRAQSWESAA